MLNELEHAHALDMLVEGSRAPSYEKHYDHVPAQAVDDFERRHRKLLRHSNIAGFGLGEKEVDGKLTDELALRIYVRTKKLKSRCDSRYRIPARLEVPGLGTVATDVVEIGVVRPHAGRKMKLRPALPGCSVGNGLVTGTLGCYVTRKNKSGVYLLTNAHVIARDGLAPKDTPVFQPAPIDESGPSTAPLAALHEIVPFEFSRTKKNNLVDAAIAKVKNAKNADNEIMGIGSPTGIAKARRGMQVLKSGRTSGVTHGKIRDIHFRIRIEYEKSNFGSLGWVGFRDQILVTRFSDTGDSGSLVVNDKGKAVGLLFAGSESTSVCNKIQNVFQALDLELA